MRRRAALPATCGAVRVAAWMITSIFRLIPTKRQICHGRKVRRNTVTAWAWWRSGLLVVAVAVMGYSGISRQPGRSLAL